MTKGRRGDHHQIDVRRLDDLFGTISDGGNAVFRTDPRGALELPVAHGLQLAARMARKIAHQVRAPVPAADHPDANRPALHAARPELANTTGIVLTRIFTSSHSDHSRT